jgi:hypothetical protein
VVGEWLAVSSVRREVKPQVYAVLVELERDGWRLRRQGHKFKAYCPCGGGIVTVNGTPRNPDWEARRIRRDAAHCPDRHDLDG